MSEPYTPLELASKVEWEGGILGALDYGLGAADLDDSDPELKAAWTELCRVYVDTFQPLVAKVERVLDTLTEPE